MQPTMNKYIHLALIVWSLVDIDALKLNQKIFVDVDAISFADSRKDGFLIVLNENFVKDHLNENQFPTLFITAVPLSGTDADRSQGRVSKIAYPERMQEGKMIKLDDLQEKAWYYVCVEFENMNRNNETTGATCKIFRTMDKFGLPAESTVSDMRLVLAGETSLKFEATVELDFPAKLTAYLSRNGAEAKEFVLRRDTNFNLTFFHLTPNSDFGSLCIIEEPLITTYTLMGRIVQARMERCFLNSLKTARVDESFRATAQPQVAQRVLGYKSERSHRSNSSPNLFLLFSHILFFCIVLVFVFTFSL